jgi:hypothetical protein
MGKLRAILVGVGGGAILAAGLTVAMDADAVYCCDPWGEVGSQSFQSMGSTIVISISSSAEQIVMELQTGLMQSWSSGFTQWAQEISKQTASQKTLVEAASFDETITSALMLADQDQTTGKALRNYGVDSLNDMVLSPYQSLTHQIMERHKRWCTSAEAKAGRCDAAAAPGMEMADTDIASVLDPHSGKTYSDEERDAAIDYVRIVIASESLRAHADYSSDQARFADGVTLADQAALGAAANSFNGMMADRTRRNQTETKQ